MSEEASTINTATEVEQQEEDNSYDDSQDVSENQTPDGVTPTRDSTSNIWGSKTEIPIAELPKVVAIKNYEPSLSESDSLHFTEGDTIRIIAKDGCGWANGLLERDSTKGWFPLNLVESLHDSPIGEIGEKPEGQKTVLEYLVEEGKKKGAAGTAEALTAVPKHLKKKPALNRRDSLNTFLRTRPLREQLAELAILPQDEAAAIEAAQRRLNKDQKKHKKRKESVLKKQTHLQAASSSNTIPNDKLDNYIIKLRKMKTGKQKTIFHSYEKAFVGSELLQFLIAPIGVANIDEAKNIAQQLLDRSAMIDVSGKDVFKTKGIYQLRCDQTEYGPVNIDKLFHGEARKAVELSGELVKELTQCYNKYLPDMPALRNSNELRRFALHLSELQKVKIDDKLTSVQKLIFYINLFNTLLLYSHAKFSPPKTMMDRRYLAENCSLILADRNELCLNDIEQLIEIPKKQWRAYFCIADCTKVTAPVYVLSEESFEAQTKHATRYYLDKHVKVNAGDYEMKFPAFVRKIVTALKIDNKKLIEMLHPLFAANIRDKIAEMQKIGDIDIKWLPSPGLEPTYIFETSSDVTTTTTTTSTTSTTTNSTNSTTNSAAATTNSKKEAD